MPVMRLPELQYYKQKSELPTQTLLRTSALWNSLDMPPCPPFHKCLLDNQAPLWRAQQRGALTEVQSQLLPVPAPPLTARGCGRAPTSEPNLSDLACKRGVAPASRGQSGHSMHGPGTVSGTGGSETRPWGTFPLSSTFCSSMNSRKSYSLPDSC